MLAFSLDLAGGNQRAIMQAVKLAKLVEVGAGVGQQASTMIFLSLS